MANNIYLNSDEFIQTPPAPKSRISQKPDVTIYALVENKNKKQDAKRENEGTSESRRMNKDATPDVVYWDLGYAYKFNNGDVSTSSL